MRGTGVSRSRQRPRWRQNLPAADVDVAEAMPSGAGERRQVVRGEGGDGAALAAAASALEQDLAVAAEEEVALPGVGCQALGGENEGGAASRARVRAMSMGQL